MKPRWGMANVEAIAQFGGRLEALHFGVADFAASMRARTTNIGGLEPALSGRSVACLDQSDGGGLPGLWLARD